MAFEANLEQRYRAQFENMGRIYTIESRINDCNQMSDILVGWRPISNPTAPPVQAYHFRSIDELLGFLNTMEDIVESMYAKLHDTRKDNENIRLQ